MGLRGNSVCLYVDVCVCVCEPFQFVYQSVGFRRICYEQYAIGGYPDLLNSRNQQ
jgi:hypothetical protein